MARVLLALLLIVTGAAQTRDVAGAAQARDPDALTALDACAAQLDPSLDVGYERIAARCPELTGVLERSPWAPWLPAGWKDRHNELSATGLRALHEALVRESMAAPGTRVLHAERVRAVLERVAQPERPPESWWARFKNWLRALLARPEPDGSAWWRRLLGEVSMDRAMLRLVTALAIALLVILAAAVVLNELRVAGVLRKRRPGRAGARGTSPVRDTRELDALEAAEPSAQPALLLGLIAARLVAQDRLPPARAFTVRELTRRARLQAEPERARLAELASVSERVRYAADAVSPAAVAGAVRGGRELLLALETSAVGAP